MIEPMPLTTFHRDIENQALSFLQDYAFTAFAFFVVSQTALAKLIYHDYPSHWVTGWLLLFLVSQTCSLIYRRRMPKSDIPQQKKLRRGMYINIVDGFFVASCLAFFPYIAQSTQLIIITILLVTCTGAIATTVGYRRFYLAFTVPILSSIVIFSIPIAISTGELENLLLLFASSGIVAYVFYELSLRIYFNFKEAFSLNLKMSAINSELKSAVKDAKKANLLKTRFLASASHDLRQPINILSLFVANLTLKDEKGEYSEIIGHMNTAINTIDTQLEALLDISKLDAGAIDVKLQETNILKHVEDLVASYPAHDNIELKFTSVARELIVVTDIVLFERIVNNLISNAIKYTNEGYIEVSFTCGGDHAILNIKDTGIGISDNELNNIFDEFYQINNPERSSSNGLGLGLAIVKRLTNLLGMEISIKSQRGIGTEVTICMDYVSSTLHKTISEDAPTKKVNSESKRVIVLDNEASIVIAMRSVLETMNHTVESFTDSNHALRAFENKDYDLALIDYRLAGEVYGDDLINIMHSLNSSTKYFLITGDISITPSDNYEVIHKPITRNKLDYILSDC